MSDTTAEKTAVEAVEPTITPVEDRSEVEVEVELDAAAQEAVKPRKTASAEDDDEDEDDDDDDDERLNADQRGSDDTARSKKRFNQRRAKIREKARREEERILFIRQNIQLQRENLETRATSLQTQAQLVERDIQEHARQYQIAERQSADAMSKGDGVKFQQWERRKQEMAAKYQESNSLKARMGQDFSTLQQHWGQLSQAMQAEPAMQQQSRQQAPQQRPATERHQRHAENFTADHPWITEDGPDAKIVRAIDIAVMADGLDPSSKSYWNELQDRLKAALPHRFGTVTRVSPPVGSGREMSAQAKYKVRLPAAVVQACKDAGYWDTPKERNDYFSRYLAAEKKERAAR